MMHFSACDMSFSLSMVARLVPDADAP